MAPNRSSFSPWSSTIVVAAPVLSLRELQRLPSLESLKCRGLHHRGLKFNSAQMAAPAAKALHDKPMHSRESEQWPALKLTFEDSRLPLVNSMVSWCRMCLARSARYWRHGPLGLRSRSPETDAGKP